MASSFGLSSFVSPAIQRDGFPEKIESKIFRKTQEVSEVIQTPVKMQPSGQKSTRRPEVRPKMVSSKRPNPYARQLMFIGSLVFVMGIGWAYMNKHIVQQYYNAYAGLVPFFYASPNDYIAINSEKFPIEQIMPKVKALNSLDNSISKAPAIVENDLEPAPLVSEIEQEVNNPLDTAAYSAVIPVETESTSAIDTIAEQLAEVSPIVVESKPEPEVIISEPQGPQYLIIAGAFREKTNADKLVLDLRAKGYTSEHVGQNKRGLWMVSVERFDNISQAKERLNIIRKEESEDCWLLKV
jgi:cell division septation protein DedD